MGQKAIFSFYSPFDGDSVCNSYSISFPLSKMNKNT